MPHVIVWFNYMSNQRNPVCQPRTVPMLGSCLSQGWGKAAMKRLWTPSCWLQLLGPWIQEPIHSERRRERAHWRHEFIFVDSQNTNSSFQTNDKLLTWLRYQRRTAMNSPNAPTDHNTIVISLSDAVEPISPQRCQRTAMPLLPATAFVAY